MKNQSAIHCAKLSIFAMVFGMLSACNNSDSESPTMEEPANVVQISTTLTSASQIPRRESQEKASGTLTLNMDTSTLSAQISFEQLNVTAAHIHQGFAGEIGSVFAAFEATSDPSVMELVETELTDAQMARLLAGGYYINLHNDNFPEGYLRGQILTEEISTRIFKLSGAQQIPHVVTTATGAAYITLNHNQSTVRVNAFIDTPNTPIAAHIHSGDISENGAPILELQQDIENPEYWYSDEQTLAQDLFELVTSGRAYLNIHTDAHPEGELRGQIVNQYKQVFSFSLDSLQARAPRVSEQQGIGNVILNRESGEASFYIATQGIEDATQAHIFSEQDTASDPIIQLNQDANDPQRFSLDTSLNSDEVEQLVQQGWKVSVGSTEYEQGAITGQVLVEPSPSGLVLDQSSLVAERNTYTINFNGQALGTAIIDMQREGDVMTITEITDAVPFGITETLSVKIDTRTLAPISYEGTGTAEGTEGTRFIDINFNWDKNRVTGSTDLQTDPFEQLLPEQTVEQLGLFYSIHTLPLAEGLEYPITVFNALDNSLTERQLTVVGIREVTVAAGTFQTYEVFLNGADVNQIFFVSQEAPRRLIQIGFDRFPITYELQP